MPLSSWAWTAARHVGIAVTEDQRAVPHRVVDQSRALDVVFVRAIGPADIDGKGLLVPTSWAMPPAMLCFARSYIPSTMRNASRSRRSMDLWEGA